MIEKIVYARSNQTVGMPGGEAVPIVFGSHWPATDPVVKSWPDLFTEDPRFGLAYSEAPPGYDDDLNELEPADDGRDSVDDAEQATAAPGERRNVRRPRS